MALGPNRWVTPFTKTMVAQFSGKATPVKAALLDQRVVAGLGNIYVCEALFRAGIAPTRKAGRISEAHSGACPNHSRRVERSHRGRRILFA